MSSGVLGLLGLGARAGTVVIGVDAVRAALQRGKCRCLVIATDMSPRAVAKVVRLANARGIRMVEGPDADEMGRALGRPPVMVVGVVDNGLAQGILRAAGSGSDGGN